MRWNGSVMALSIILLVTISGALVFAVLWIDKTLSYSYLQASHEATVENARLVSSLLEKEWLGLPKKEVLNKLRNETGANNPHRAIVKVDDKQGVIWLNEVRLQFESGKLKSIGM